MTTAVMIRESQVVRIRLPNSQNRICWLSSGRRELQQGEQGLEQEQQGDARQDQGLAADMAHHGQTKQQAGGKHAHNEGTGRDGHQGRKPEAAGVEGQRRARPAAAASGYRDWRGVVQQGLHLHAAKTEGRRRPPGP